MRVALVAAAYFAVVGLVGRVHVHVLLAVRAVGETTIAALELALERLLAYSQKKKKKRDISYLNISKSSVTRLDECVTQTWRTAHSWKHELASSQATLQFWLICMLFDHSFLCQYICTTTERLVSFLKLFIQIGILASFPEIQGNVSIYCRNYTKALVRKT